MRQFLLYRLTHRLVAVLLLLLWLPEQVPAAEATMQAEGISIDFLYINANAGEAAGGHTALRLGDAVFHYQFFPDATFLLVREPWDSFRFLYNDLHNRSIAIASLPLDFTTATQIRNHFTELLAAQEQFFNDLEQLQKEEQFLQGILAGSSEIEVDGLGFFTKNQTSDFQAGLVEYIETRLGTVFLQKSANETEEELQRAVTALNMGKMPGTPFQEILAVREAFRVLLEGYALEEHAFIPVLEEEHGLSPAEQVFLRSFGEYLAKSIVDLLQSVRPDRGEVILLQTARYLAVQYSLATGQLFTLDPFFEDVREVQLTDEDIEGGRLASLQEGLQKQSARRRELFFKEERHPEIAYSLMETSRARAWELLRVNDEERKVRILAKVTLPTRPGKIIIDTLHADRAKIQESARALEGELGVQHTRREELYGYNLFTRNCATELIRSLNSTFPDPESGAALLGGWMEPDSGLAFIPFLFYEQSLTAFSLQDEQFLQARRLRNLETLYDQENDLLVWFRESNTLSSSLYQPRSKDTPFLFFTDDSLLFRPVLGVMNVLYGALHGVAGIAVIPFDGGDHFNQALRGIFYSLPELAFGNIRKGSYSVGESEGTL
jgi:hypothetical protein